ncbi:EF hand family protein [Trichomonas vaginalis G3]|uniref:EF hand family protein n=1 Tax=Trichomonas vaginalis (strain ATCC PRA-98 / G3) TaxID=412133 RepID=A2FWD1_TRIV3|nr:protein serine/threonine kinase protein [Trichomonas vaginalis G3]EAX90795.1 EF hand family protein [Trichomonas vaginalis G3]KAI5507040.1 protein serine/threonine kinase protein [Trichomonas vaginalis G3]|eukprot:XP_001303725.1 EF hand family protein [Trichomonas vaginalis G3]
MSSTYVAPQRKYIDMSTLMNRIRQRIVERGAVGIKGIGRLFRIADDDNNKIIDLKNELPKLMNDIGVILNKTELNELIRLLDSNGNGTIDYDEFLYQMAPPMNEERIKWCNKAFDKLDKDGSGVVAIEDFKMVYNPESSELVKMGKTTAGKIFANLLASYDTDADGKITRTEFIDYYRHISPSIDNDEYFGLMMTNAWKL